MMGKRDRPGTWREHGCPVEAMLFDGTPACADAIVRWVNDGPDFISVEHPEGATVVVDGDGRGGDVMSLWVPATRTRNRVEVGDWVVVRPGGDGPTLAVMSPDTFLGQPMTDGGDAARRRIERRG
jgi:hypothetical protein